MTQDQTASVRADLWLWAARFYKTRPLARAALVGGQVEHNGQRCKPGRAIVAGDRLRIRKGEDEFRIRVLAVSRQRGPAAVAQELYAEDADSRRAREERRARARLSRPVRPAKSPDKTARRKLRDWKRGRGDW